jgi:hypothetical protein
VVCRGKKARGIDLENQTIMLPVGQKICNKAAFLGVSFTCDSTARLNHEVPACISRLSSVEPH